MRRKKATAFWVGLLLASAGHAAVLDDFEAVAAWSAHPSDGVKLEISSDAGLHGRAMRMDFDFQGHAGYAIARRGLDLDLPANYEIAFQIRGETPVENLEVKLIDASGENVWWMNRREFAFPRRWTEVVTRKRQISFAWGPAGGGEIRHVAAIEIVVTAGSGGKGKVWVDDLAMRELPPPGGPVKRGPWKAAEGEAAWTVDLGARREVGGLRIRWGEPARDFDVELSNDGRAWRTAREVGSNRRQDELVFLPDEEARLLRLAMKRSGRGRGYAIESVEVEPPEWAPTANDFFAVVAKSAPRGDYPRWLVGEQPYWTVVGAEGADAKALVGEDGDVEPFQGGFSIEPLLVVDGRVVTWAEAAPRQSLAQGYLPIPTVSWTFGETSMEMTAAVTDSSMLLLRYRVRGGNSAKVSLALAVRPFQVNPATQFLNAPGGVSSIHEVAFAGRDLHVDRRRIFFLTQPSFFVGSTYDEGGIIDRLRRGEPGSPSAATVSDPLGYASGAVVFPVSRDQTIDVLVPLEPGAKPIADAGAEIRRIASAWREKLDRVAIVLPGAPEIADTIRASLAWTLVHRDGDAIQPGSRSYARAWIRDGALISAVLLRLGHVDEAKRFAAWFAARQYPDGKVPCCVDRRGADPVPENDSHGELIYLVAEIARTTGDLGLARRLWPHVDGAARFIVRLAGENHGPFEGLVTESISHEGYSAKPVHSYWDDLFALRGLDDAAYLAGALGLADRRRELAGQAAVFRSHLAASIRATIAGHHIDFVPGSAELGDLDATSTAIGISPLNLTGVFPPAELRRTFDRYLGSLEKPRPDYTPYEMRIVGALIRLGEKTRALPLLDRFLADRRPPGWREWAEVVGTDARKPRFVGDMPHAWVASDFVRAVLDAIAYDREDGALVVGAGIPRSWLAGGTLHAGPLATYSGPLDVQMRAEGDRILVDLEGAAHPAQLILHSPDDRPIRRATIDGREVEHGDHELTVPRLPAEVVFEH
jgi:hypothetical protein